MTAKIEAVDLFCGVGGLTRGLEDAGIDVKAGFDMDEECKFAYEENNEAEFVAKDVKAVVPEDIEERFSDDSYTMIAGCAPCQPFSSMSNVDTKRDSKWALLKEFARLVEEVEPDFVTMENVPELQNHEILEEFKERLESAGYNVSGGTVYAPDYGVPQTRNRFILMASKHSDITLPDETHSEEEHPTVREKIESLEKLEAGERSDKDPLHWAAGLSSTNIERIQHSEPGGTWEDWPERLKLECHKKDSGSTFTAVYGRMEWDKPAPTMTTQCYAYGSGRFGHPEQDRAITLREAAIFQTFGENYKFFKSKEETPKKTKIGRWIGNAVPVKLGTEIGNKFLTHSAEC